MYIYSSISLSIREMDTNFYLFVDCYPFYRLSSVQKESICK